MVFLAFYAILTLALTQFVLRVLLTDNEQPTFATHDLAVGSAFFYRCSCLHNDIESLFVSKNDSTFSKVVGTHLHLDLVAGQYADVVHTHLA